MISMAQPMTVSRASRVRALAVRRKSFTHALELIHFRGQGDR